MTRDDVIRRYLPPHVRRAIELLEVGTRIMEEWATTPERREQVDRHFMAFQPSGEFGGTVRVELYDAHVRELLGRMPCGHADLEHPTDAEVLLGLVNASRYAPLDELGSALYARLARYLMPEGPAIFDDVPEAWPGQVDEELARVKRRRVPRARRDRAR